MGMLILWQDWSLWLPYGSSGMGGGCLQLALWYMHAMLALYLQDPDAYLQRVEKEDARRAKWREEANCFLAQWVWESTEVVWFPRLVIATTDTRNRVLSESTHTMRCCNGSCCRFAIWSFDFSVEAPFFLQEFWWLGSCNAKSLPVVIARCWCSKGNMHGQHQPSQVTERQIPLQESLPRNPMRIYMYKYIDAVKLSSGPSLASLSVVIWAKFVCF